MKESDDMRFGALLVGLAEVLGEAVSGARITAYFNALKEFEFADVERAINKAARTLRFFPKPVELVEIIEGSPETHAAQAWALIVRAIETGGYYSSMFIEDRAAAFAFRRTFPSWTDAAAQMPPVGNPMHASLRKIFVKAYGDAKRDNLEADRYFIGYLEAQNRGNVGMFDPVHASGDTEYTQKIMVIAGGRLFESSMAFSRYTGQLTEASRQALLTGQTQPALLRATELPPARMIEGEADPLAVMRQVKQLAT